MYKPVARDYELNKTKRRTAMLIWEGRWANNLSVNQIAPFFNEIWQSVNVLMAGGLALWALAAASVLI